MLEITGKLFVKTVKSIGFVENPSNSNMLTQANFFIPMESKASLVSRIAVRIARLWAKMKCVRLLKRVTKIISGRQDKEFISRNQSHVNPLILSFRTGIDTYESSSSL
jgi:hypothetical protein